MAGHERWHVLNKFWWEKLETKMVRTVNRKEDKLQRLQ